MNRIIRKVAILGAGVMGSRIACHFANIGVNVLLLDLSNPPAGKNELESGNNIQDQGSKNRYVNKALEDAVKSDPAPLYRKEFISRIKTGTFGSDMPKISDCDWIIETVVEDPVIKKNILEKVDQSRTAGSLVSTNTSGISIHSLMEGRSEDFVKNFCGTHFFNPPRYLRLMELIPTSKTDPEVIDFIKNYGELFLGKLVIVCKDTPGFIANRIGIFNVLKVIEIMENLGLGIDEIDKLTGTISGKPKSATFRTSDIVGIDTLIKVADHLNQKLTRDEDRDNFKVPSFVNELIKRSWLGDKTRQGFYKKIKNKKGESEIFTLDHKDFEYKPRKKVKFKTIESAKSIDNFEERIKILYHGDDKAGEFYRTSFLSLFHYISFRVPEVTEDIYKIDEALCAGFGWESGPFAIWDNLGFEQVLMDMKNADIKVSSWITEMQSKGFKSFYKTERGIRKYYNPAIPGYSNIPGMEGFIILDNLRTSNLVWSNSGSSLIDLGDGILNIEFHTKMNTIGSEVIEGINKGIDIAEKDFRGVVIGNTGRNFSVGANLGILFMLAIEQDYKGIQHAVRLFQNTVMRVRYSGIPVVAAPHDLSLGGSCEMSLHADHVQAAAETYIGLVEAGAGLIPGGGGSKEMTSRAADQYEEGDIELNTLQNIFMTMATGKVSSSAHDAFSLRYLRPGDEITMKSDQLIHDAKQAAIRLADKGYTMPDRNRKIKVQGKSGMGSILAGIHGMKSAGYISDYDVKIAQKIAWIVCGGDLSSPMEVSADYLLELEREAFLSLCGERKTLERIESILQGRKPLRN